MFRQAFCVSDLVLFVILDSIRPFNGDDPSKGDFSGSPAGAVIHHNRHHHRFIDADQSW